MHYWANCLTREMPPHNLLPCCNLCLFYSPPQVYFVDISLDDLSLWCLGSARSSFSVGWFPVVQLVRIRSMFIRWKWPNHWRWRFLITAVSCLVLELIELFVICWDHITHKILHWQHMSKASSLASSCTLTHSIKIWTLMNIIRIFKNRSYYFFFFTLKTQKKE